MNNTTFYALLFSLCQLLPMSIHAQSKGTTNDKWIKVSSDEDVTITYNTKIVTDKDSSHFVWMKAVCQTSEWQNHFARLID